MREATRVYAPSGGETKTKQAMADQCDVNLIVKRHAQTGMYDHLNPVEPQFGDVSQALDLEDAMNLVAEQESAFMQLPPEVREACDNDVPTYYRMIATEEGLEALEDAGLPVRWTEQTPDPRIARREAEREALRAELEAESSAPQPASDDAEGVP